MNAKYSFILILSLFVGSVPAYAVDSSDFERGYQAGLATCNGNPVPNCAELVNHAQQAFDQCMSSPVTTRLQCIHIAYSRYRFVTECAELSQRCMDNCLPGAVTTRVQCVEACY